MSYERQRTLRICYWDGAKRQFGRHKAIFEKYLKRLGDLSFYEMKTLEDPAFAPCDLLVVAAETVPLDNFAAWLRELHQRIKKQHKIWTPAIVLSSADFGVLEDLLSEVNSSNWYFDIINPDHMASLPIRVANLLRIHDHLHELRRYDEKQRALQEQLSAIEEKLRLASTRES